MQDTRTLTIANLYTAGATLKEVAVQLGTSSESVRRALQEAGTPRRPRGAPVGKHRPAGGAIVDSDGYVLIRSPEHPAAVNGYVPEHRLVMEKVLGRPLLAEEIVGHRNGIRDDNRPENLELFSSASPFAASILTGNARAKGDIGNPKRRVRRKRSVEQMRWELAALRWTLGRDIRRSDLQPPHPSWRAVARAFGSWQAGVEQALQAYPEDTYRRLTSRSSLHSEEVPRAHHQKGH